MSTRVYLSQLTDTPTRELYEFARKIPERENEFVNPFRKLFNYEEFKITLSLLMKDGEFNSTRLHYEGRVPEFYYWVRTENGEPIGLAKVRFLLTGHLLRNGGHLELWLKPESRERGYSTKALRELLQIEKDHDVRDIWLTVRSDNIPARKAAERIGGKSIDQTAPYQTAKVANCRYLVKL